MFDYRLSFTFDKEGTELEVPTLILSDHARRLVQYAGIVVHRDVDIGNVPLLRQEHKTDLLSLLKEVCQLELSLVAGHQFINDDSFLAVKAIKILLGLSNL